MTGKPKEVDHKTDQSVDKRSPGEDAAERPYYYDDAHGYEEFDPDLCEDDDAGEIEAGKPALGRIRRG